MARTITISAAAHGHAGLLALIRVEAMRPSLEAVGRFDPERARRRFLDTFNPEETWLINADGAVAGFYVVRRHAGHLSLDHLYVRHAEQGQGLGRFILEKLKEDARRLGLPIRLMALKDSPSNPFYRHAGFQLIRAEAFDNHYEWQA